MLTKENGFALPVNWKFPEAKNYAFTFIALFIALLAIYSNSFYGEWQFDDYPNIVSNPYVKLENFSWSEIKQCIYGLEQQRPSRPLSYLSFALNHHFHGLDVFGYHLVNFGIHYLSAIFLFLFIINALKLPLLKNRYENIAYPVALLATFFWAIHPLWVTSVTYIVQRMASMAGLFYIMSMFFYLKARISEKSLYSVFLYILCIIAGLAAVLSKENAVMLPISILLFDLFLIQGVSKNSVKRFIKFIILPFIIIVSTGLVYTGGFSNAFGGFELRDFTMVQRLLTEPRVILFYLTLLIYPINSRLTLLYDIDVSHSLIAPWTTLPSILIIILVMAFSLYLAKKYRLWAFCVIFYFINHFIEGSFFSLELIYEHRNYIPAMLLFIPVAEIIILAINYFSYRRVVQFIVSSIIVITVVGLGDITYRRNNIVADEFKLWFDNINKYPNLSRPHSNIGNVYIEHKQKDKGLLEYEKAMILNNFASNYSRAMQEHNLGLFYYKEKKYDLALPYFEKSFKTLPKYLSNAIHIAKIELANNKIAEARMRIESLLKKYPSNTELLELFVIVLMKENKFNESRKIARQLLKISPSKPFPKMILAELNRQKGNDRAAISFWALYRNSVYSDPYANVALIELYAKTKNVKMLDIEISKFFFLKGNKSFDDYLTILSQDKNLLVYVPEAEKIINIIKERINSL